jgi:hypothetical protein
MPRSYPPEFRRKWDFVMHGPDEADYTKWIS